MKNDIIDQCYKKSTELLLKNSTKFGVIASSMSKKAKERNYLNIFGRDASICSIGMVMSGNKKLLKPAKRNLEVLASYQADNGQIPNSVRFKQKKASFWVLGSIDATLWWLIATEFYIQYSGEKSLRARFKNNIKKAIDWLLCQEHAVDGLVMQNEASDWADIFPRSGKVLYSNALWCRVKELYKIKAINKTKANFNNLFYPFDCLMKDIPEGSVRTIKLLKRKMKRTSYYLSYINYLFWGNDIDIFGNSLAILFNLSNKKMQKRVVKYFLSLKKPKQFPTPALFNPVKENSKYWRDYMKIYNQNIPYQYHNGGIWPFASCFWAMALVRAGKKYEAEKELERIALFNKINNWQFNEWFHGKTGKPMGMPGQSWNAAMFLLAYHYLKGDFKI